MKVDFERIEFTDDALVGAISAAMPSETFLAVFQYVAAMKRGSSWSMRLFLEAVEAVCGFHALGLLGEATRRLRNAVIERIWLTGEDAGLTSSAKSLLDEELQERLQERLQEDWTLTAYVCAQKVAKRGEPMSFPLFAQGIKQTTDRETFAMLREALDRLSEAFRERQLSQCGPTAAASKGAS